MRTKDSAHKESSRTTIARWLIATGLLVTVAGHAAAADRTEKEKSLNLVPWPKTVELTGGSMKLTAESHIAVGDRKLVPLAKVLAGEIRQITGLDLKLKEQAGNAGDIVLAFAPDPKGSAPAAGTGPASLKGASEAYKLEVTDRAVVSAGTYQGMAWGTVTLLQAIAVKDSVASIQGMTITDKPFAPYRGAMLDLARRMNMIQEVRQCVVLCRLYKIRYLHLHLSDDHAWVFPSTKFPKLGESNTGYEGMAPYVFKLSELRDLVTFADERGVTLIPEVDVPGHTDRLRIDYPLIFDTGEPNKPACMGILNMSFDKAQDGMNTIVGEMIDVFKSSPFFHFGADEPRVDMAAGRTSYAPYMKKMGLADPYELYLHFIGLMDSYVSKYGRSSLIWADFSGNSTPRTKVPTDVTCMCWQNDSSGADALTKQGYSVINATWNPLYAVNAKATCPEITDPLRGGMSPMESIYRWNMYTFDKCVIPPTDKVVGAQVCSWESGGEVQVPLLRWRLPALSERVWSPDAGKTFGDFTSRFDAINPLVDKLIQLGADGYVTEWMISGPYAADGAAWQKLVDTELEPEKAGKKVEWKRVVNGKVRPWILRLDETIGGINRAAYVKAQVFSPKAQDVRLEIGSDDGAKVWINGSVVHSVNGTRGYQPGSDVVKVSLKEGWNNVMMKVTQGEGDWVTSLRVLAANGKALDGLLTRAE